MSPIFIKVVSVFLTVCLGAIGLRDSYKNSRSVAYKFGIVTILIFVLWFGVADVINTDKASTEDKKNIEGLVNSSTKSITQSLSGTGRAIDDSFQKLRSDLKQGNSKTPALKAKYAKMDFTAMPFGKKNPTLTPTGRSDSMKLITYLTNYGTEEARAITVRIFFVFSADKELFLQRKKIEPLTAKTTFVIDPDREITHPLVNSYIIPPGIDSAFYCIEVRYSDHTQRKPFREILYVDSRNEFFILSADNYKRVDNFLLKSRTW